jgi:transposase
VKHRTAQVNQICGLLSEFGIVMPKGINILTVRITEILEDTENEFTCGIRDLIKEFYERVKTLTAEIYQQEFTIRGTNRTL